MNSDWEKIKLHGAILRDVKRNLVKKLADMSVDDVMSVYSGKAGACCCGCSGNYRYNSKHVNRAGKSRGYEVSADEVNDRQVKRVLNIVKKNVSGVSQVGEGLVFEATVDNRYYMVHGVR